MKALFFQQAQTVSQMFECHKLDADGDASVDAITAYNCFGGI